MSATTFQVITVVWADRPWIGPFESSFTPERWACCCQHFTSTACQYWILVQCWTTCACSVEQRLQTAASESLSARYEGLRGHAGFATCSEYINHDTLVLLVDRTAAADICYRGTS